jgi:hypothetical protein
MKFTRGHSSFGTMAAESLASWSKCPTYRKREHIYSIQEIQHTMYLLVNQYRLHLRVHI